MCKSPQNNSSNGGPDAVLKVALRAGLNVATEGAPYISL